MGEGSFSIISFWFYSTVSIMRFLGIILFILFGISAGIYLYTKNQKTLRFGGLGLSCLVSLLRSQTILRAVGKRKKEI